MIFDFRKKVMYSQNREALRPMGMEFPKGYMPHYEKYKGYEDEFVVWFNYEAVKNAYGKYENPSDNEYINIYSDDCDYIEEIVPLDKKITGNDNSLARVVFKKIDKNASYFCGVYVVDHISNRSVFLKRISLTFNTDNVYEITPTDNYFFYIKNQENNNYPFGDILAKLKPNRSAIPRKDFAQLEENSHTSSADLERLLFCNISYMKYYHGITDDDRPMNGGEYVLKNGDANEKYNFMPDKDGKIKGFVETKHRGGYESGSSAPNQLHIENIDPAYKSSGSIDNVTVVFFATGEKGRTIVGWYKDATIYRNREITTRLGESYEYNIEADMDRCYLVPEKERTFLLSNSAYSFEFGQSLIRYIRTDDDIVFAKNVMDYIHDVENKEKTLINEETEKIDSINSYDIDQTEKQTLIKARVGQGLFKKRTYQRDCCCVLCGMKNDLLLRASHIKAWSKCKDGNERLDENNGLTLCVLHDALFDNKLITFDENGKIIISRSLSQDDFDKLNLKDDFVLPMSEKMKQYMSYHRKQYYEDSNYIKHDKYGVGKILSEDKEEITTLFIDDNQYNGEIKTFKKALSKDHIKKI